MNIELSNFTSIPEQFNPELITQTYFGKQGCACGCGGNYHTTSRMSKTAQTKLKNKLKEGETLDFMQWETAQGKIETCLSWEGDDRAIRIYTETNSLTY